MVLGKFERMLGRMDEVIQQALLDANLSVTCKRWLQDDEAPQDETGETSTLDDGIGS
jgi:hypothetical protein